MIASKPIKNLILATMVLCSIQAQSKSDQNQPLTCTADEFEQMFFSQVPQYKGLELYLHALGQKNGIDPACLKAIEESPQIQSHLNNGRMGRKAYFEFYAQDFDGPGIKLVATPELEILRRLYSTIELGKSRKASAPPKDWDIRSRALSETLTRFGLPASLTSSQFEKLVNSNSKYNAAKSYYQKREHQLRELMTTSGATTTRSPEQFKASMVDQLYSLRVMNFIGAVKNAEELQDKKIKFKHLNGHAEFDISVGELLNMSVQFLESQNGVRPNYEVLNLPKSKQNKWATRFARGWIDSSTSVSLYGDLAFSPNWLIA